MEILLVLLVLIAVPVIFVSAKRGAEAAQLERAERWGELPGARSGGISLRRAGAHERASPASQPTRPAAAFPAGDGTAGAARSGVAGDGAMAVEDAGHERAARPERRQPGSERPPGIEGARRAVESAAQSAGATARSMRSSATAALRREPVPIDINRAPVSELQDLPGVGVRAAERIVAHRERHGRFASVEDLAAVEGFDQHRVARLSQHAVAR